MKHISIYLVLGLCFLLSFAGKSRPTHIFMAGDSTMANKPLYKTVVDSITGDSIIEPFPERGWGQVLPDYFTDKVVIENYALNGRSTRTFIEQGWWKKIVDNMQKGDYVVIQFGHNDSSPDKVDRYTSPEDYRRNLQGFVSDVLARGGTPILCTSVARRKFDKNGQFQDSHGVYLDIVREVAMVNKVPMVDMYKGSKEFLISLGDESSKPFFMHLAKGENRIYPNGLTDNTHFVDQGARSMALLFVNGIQDLKLKKLTKYLKN